MPAGAGYAGITLSGLADRSEGSAQFAEHIGVSDNQLPFGVLESLFSFFLGEPWGPESRGANRGGHL